jgi:hypothetical protein
MPQLRTAPWMTSENKHFFYQHFEKKIVFWVSTFHFQIVKAAFKLILAMRTLALHASLYTSTL